MGVINMDDTISNDDLPLLEEEDEELEREEEREPYIDWNDLD